MRTSPLAFGTCRVCGEIVVGKIVSVVSLKIKGRLEQVYLDPFVTWPSCDRPPEWRWFGTGPGAPGRLRDID